MIDGIFTGVITIKVGICTGPKVIGLNTGILLKVIIDGTFNGEKSILLGTFRGGSINMTDGILNPPKEPKGFRSKQGKTIGGNVRVVDGGSILGITIGGNTGKMGTGTSKGFESGVAGGSVGVFLTGGV
jgi:hypothetical protein